ITDASFTWPSSNDNHEALSVPSLVVEHGQLLAVVGKVGAGKSALLFALLGEMQHTSGEVFIDHKRTFAHVSQAPWLMSTTIRENILFGLPYDELWYAKVVDACELRRDLDHLASGDLTVVGNGGMALSGGQRIRVALARAVYAQPDVILLDNILASVDAHVSKRLFDRVLSPATGLLAGTTCIAVTQSPAVLAAAHKVCVVTKGCVSQPRSLSQLLNDANTDFCVAAGISTVEPPVISEPQMLLATPPNSGTLRSATIEKESTPTITPSEAAPSAPLTKSPPQQLRRLHQYVVPVRYMLRLCGGSVVALHCLTVAAQCIASRKAQLWLAKPIPLAHEQTNNIDPQWWWSWHPTMWHFAMCALWWIADIGLELTGLWWTEVVWRRSMFVKSHGELLDSTAGAPLSYFARMPLGRILALFTDSQQDVDTRMPQRLANLATFAVKLVFESWVIMSFHPALIASVAAVILAMRYIVTTSQGPLAVFLTAQNEARPMIDEQYQEALTGAQTIRVFGEHAHTYATRKLNDRLSAFVSAQRAGDCIETWIDMAMALLRCAATSIAFGIALLGASNGVSIDPTYMSLVYWSITFLLARIQHLVRHSHALSSSLDRAARFIEFTAIESEASLRARLTTTDSTASDQWPHAGNVVFDNVCARYRSNESCDEKAPNDATTTDLVLRQMSFTISSGQHIGIVGRTGAGKTSIAMALFGLLSPESGTISIDSVDLASSGVTLDMLRERLAVVPQTAPILPGTVRHNMDPRSAHSDDEIQQALNSVGLTACSLDDRMLEAWSIGQRQLLSVARALLKQSRILVLDEATASIDLHASLQLHAVIRQRFAKCTVITIAHRLETVYDCDTVLVIADGQVQESGSPSLLLANPESAFAQLAAAANAYSQAIDTFTC
ncbi:Multidrug resistance-associated protein 1, partial [Coemansia aciculifera]